MTTKFFPWTSNSRRFSRNIGFSYATESSGSLATAYTRNVDSRGATRLSFGIPIRSRKETPTHSTWMTCGCQQSIRKEALQGTKCRSVLPNPAGKNPEDVWSIPNVKSNHVEKTGHPCQFPAGLSSRPFFRSVTCKFGLRSIRRRGVCRRRKRTSSSAFLGLRKSGGICRDGFEAHARCARWKCDIPAT